ncbi:hypothetical protein H6F96_00035 [Microcoleus sp. FACHB-53]|jgi:glutamate/tyrosine decarboxylase-like PLP-dependent enzyme|nr:hypothetical protein [Microcoleus sp. FACHB-53]
MQTTKVFSRSEPADPISRAIANLIQFDQPLPHEPVEPELVLQQLDEIGSPASMIQAGYRFFGFVTGGSLPAALAANWLAAAWNQNCGLYRITPATALDDCRCRCELPLKLLIFV